MQNKNRKFKNLSILIISCLVLVSCSTKTKQTISDSEYNKDNSILSPVISDIPVNDATSNLDALEPTNEHLHTTLFDSINEGFESDSSGINYSNYTNHMPLIRTGNILLEFSYDGTIKRSTGDKKTNETLHIRDILEDSNILDKDNPDADWFFVSAISNQTYIYAQYDYWGESELSILVRMDLNGEHANVCISKAYYENESLNSYAVTNDYIYYTYHSYTNDNEIVSSILITDLNGSNPMILKSFEPGYIISSLTPKNNQLFFSVADINGKASIYLLNTNDLNLIPVIEDCVVLEFLYLYEDFAVVGSTDTQLIYYKFYDNTPHYLTVCENQGLQLGSLLINDSGCYIPIFSWEDKSPTKIVPVYFETNSIDDYILFSYSYSRIVGIDNEAIYTETGTEYKAYNIESKTELSF